MDIDPSQAGSIVFKRPALAILALAIALYAMAAIYCVANGRIWIDEASYVVKSLRYVTGTLHPYTAEDATWYMPLYFYQLGWAQELFGAGHETGRWMSALLGLASGGVLYLICRRLELGALISALAVALYLLTPTTTYYFSGATPIATVAFLLMLAVYLIVIGRDRPQLWISAALGGLFWALFFYRQNMILAIVVLAPAYIYLIGSDRRRHALFVLLAGSVLTALTFAAFPDKLLDYALRLPLLTPLLQKIHALPGTWSFIEKTTDSRYDLSPSLARLSWRDPVDAFLLPFLGTTMLAGAVLVVPRAPRFAKVTGLFFFFLALTHYLGSAGYCAACILTYTSYFVGIGILAAAFALFTAVRAYGPGVGAMLAATAMVFNATGTFYAVPDANNVPSPYRAFPFPLMDRTEGLPELESARRLAKIFDADLPRQGEVMVLHDFTVLPYAVSLAGRPMPVQALNLRQSYRPLRAGLADDEKARARAVLEGESFWCDETLQDWLESGVSGVVIQESVIPLPASAREALARNFTLKANVLYSGYPIGIYVRRGDGA